MRKLLFRLVFITPIIASCQAQVQKADFDKFSWLQGTWTGELNGQPFYENWTRVGDFEYSNINFEICNGDTVINNRSRIEIRGGTIAYTSGELSWNLREATLNSCVFENSRFNERFVFSNPKQGSWIAELHYPASMVTYQLRKAGDINSLLQQHFSGISGKFSGFMKFNEQKIPFVIDFDTASGSQKAFASIPDNLQLQRPFSDICFNPPYLRLTTREGERNIDMLLKMAGDSITGILQDEFPVYVSLIRNRQGITPKPTYSIKASKLVKGTTTLPYNIYLPYNSKNSAAVIIISGTGQHTKEEYNGWADMLVRQGIAVLIYDKRNVTSFPQLNIRQRTTDIGHIDSLVADVQDMYQVLKNQPGINPAKIGLLGFSQGAVVAPIVAANNPGIAFVIAISGNATTDKEFIIIQELSRLKQRNTSESNIKEANEIWEQLFNYAKSGEKSEEIQKRLDQAYESGYGQYCLPRHLPNDDELKYLMTWNSFDLDPAAYWQKIQVPSLVIFGGADQLIPVEHSTDILTKIFSKNPALLTLKVFPEADHTIKIQQISGRIIFPKFTEGYLNLLQSWLSKIAK